MSLVEKLLCVIVISAVAYAFVSALIDDYRTLR
jgi:hypothetical protein